MPRPVGYGRPGTKVFPDDWAANQGRVLEGTLDCVVRVGTPGTTATWNPTSRQTETTAAAATYEGAASVTPDMETTTEPVVGDEQVSLRRYQVALKRAAAGITADMVVTITSCPGDSDLEGRRLKVVAVEYDPRRFTRVLQAVDAA